MTINCCNRYTLESGGGDMTRFILKGALPERDNEYVGSRGKGGMGSSVRRGLADKRS